MHKPQCKQGINQDVRLYVSAFCQSVTHVFFKYTVHTPSIKLDGNSCVIAG